MAGADRRPGRHAALRAGADRLGTDLHRPCGLPRRARKRGDGTDQPAFLSRERGARRLSRGSAGPKPTAGSPSNGGAMGRRRPFGPRTRRVGCRIPAARPSALLARRGAAHGAGDLGQPLSPSAARPRVRHKGRAPRGDRARHRIRHRRRARHGAGGWRYAPSRRSSGSRSTARIWSSCRLRRCAATCAVSASRRRSKSCRCGSTPMRSIRCRRRPVIPRQSSIAAMSGGNRGSAASRLAAALGPSCGDPIVIRGRGSRAELEQEVVSRVSTTSRSPRCCRPSAWPKGSPRVTCTWYRRIRALPILRSRRKSSPSWPRADHSSRPPGRGARYGSCSRKAAPSCASRRTTSRGLPKRCCAWRVTRRSARPWAHAAGTMVETHYARDVVTRRLLDCIEGTA